MDKHARPYFYVGFAARTWWPRRQPEEGEEAREDGEGGWLWLGVGVAVGRHIADAFGGELGKRTISLF